MSRTSYYPYLPPQSDRKRLIWLSVIVFGALTTLLFVGMLVRRSPSSKGPGEQELPGAQRDQAEPATRVAGVGEQGATGADLQLSQGVWSACMLPSSGLHFSTDMDALPASDRLGLESLVGCLRDGALAGRKVELVGHTGGPGVRGEGFRRASALGQFFKVKGLYPEQVVVASITEEPGVPPPVQSLARRVDINLVP